MGQCSIVKVNVSRVNYQRISPVMSELSFQYQNKMKDRQKFQMLLTPEHCNKLVSLAGPNSAIQCYIENKSQIIFGDTYANISFINKSTLKQWYPGMQIRDMKDFEEFEVRWGNQTKLPFIGWVELKVSLKSKVNPDVIIKFLVRSEPLDFPNLGTNTINYKVTKSYITINTSRNTD